MKKVISLTLLIIIVVLGGQFIVNKLTKTHIYKYSIHVNESSFNVIENYQKKNNNTYSIEINDGTNSFYYVIDNTFNKQKKIITNIEYYKDGDNSCLVPILKDNQVAYIECVSNNNLYSSYTYPNQEFISNIINELKTKYPEEEKEVAKSKDSDIQNYGSLTIYNKNIKTTDTIALWQYKGILLVSKEEHQDAMNLNFDKYENKLGCLVGKYYVMPNYTNSNVLEFSSVTIVDVTNGNKSRLQLDYVLSSNTYINGVINGKLYYTDPSNLLQVEINPKKKNASLIGSNDIGGQTYNNGKWESTNIYDFASREIKFSEVPEISFDHREIVDSGSSYYYYTSDGSIYQLLKDHLDKPILVYRANGLNNFSAINNDVFYVVNETLYEFNIINGNVPIIASNDLIYNNYNRISIYRSK